MRYTIFGESHGPAIGVVLEDVPPGLRLDLEAVERELRRRAPGQNQLSTPRREADAVKILSGLFEGRTCGTPLCAVIENTDTRSGDYQNDLPRPGHADYTGHVRYEGCKDYRGGGACTQSIGKWSFGAFLAVYEGESKWGDHTVFCTFRDSGIAQFY